jgi:hypothetical protein
MSQFQPVPTPPQGPLGKLLAQTRTAFWEPPVPSAEAEPSSAPRPLTLAQAIQVVLLREFGGDRNSVKDKELIDAMWGLNPTVDGYAVRTWLGTFPTFTGVTRTYLVGLALAVTAAWMEAELLHDPSIRTANSQRRRRPRRRASRPEG